MMPSRIFPFMTDYQLSAVPLFIFMAAMLEKAGIIEELFDVIYKWLGALKGGLASATVVACTLLAAMVGVVGATEVTMGMIALPAMLRRGYDPKLACGSLLAGGTLGILIPPSVMAIVYAVVAQQSLGELLIGSVFPGLAALRACTSPTSRSAATSTRSSGPALPLEERVEHAREAAAAAQHHRADAADPPGARRHLLRHRHARRSGRHRHVRRARRVRAASPAHLDRRSTKPAMATLKATAMVMWIFFGATMFVGFFIVKGGQTFVSELILGTGLPPYGILLLMMVDPVHPRHVPRLGRHPAADRADLPADHEEPDVRRRCSACPASRRTDIPLWYGVIFMVNMQMAFLSPPFGYSLFYLKSEPCVERYQPLQPTPIPE